MNQVLWILFLSTMVTASNQTIADNEACRVSEGWVCGFGTVITGSFCSCAPGFSSRHQTNSTSLCTCSRPCRSSETVGLQCGYKAKCSLRSKCECDHGYTKINNGCEETDACLTGTHSCIWPQYCVNTNDSYVCVCDDGLEVFCIGSTPSIITWSSVSTVTLVLIFMVVFVRRRRKRQTAPCVDSSGIELPTVNPVEITAVYSTPSFADRDGSLRSASRQPRVTVTKPQQEPLPREGSLRSGSSSDDKYQSWSSVTRQPRIRVALSPPAPRQREKSASRQPRVPRQKPPPEPYQREPSSSRQTGRMLIEKAPVESGSIREAALRSARHKISGYEEPVIKTKVSSPVPSHKDVEEPISHLVIQSIRKGCTALSSTTSNSPMSLSLDRSLNEYEEV